MTEKNRKNNKDHPIRKYSDDCEKWIATQVMRYPNGLTVSDTIIPGNKPKKRSKDGEES